MREFESPIRESHLRVVKSSDAEDIVKATELIREAFPESLGRVQQRIALAARRLGWSWSKAKKVWYGEAPFIRAHQMADLEAARIKEARRAHAAYVQKTADLAAFLERQDADFHRHQVAAMRQATGAGRPEPTSDCKQAGRVDRAGTEER